MTGAELPQGRRGQLLAVAILVLLLGAGWLAVGAPLADWYAARQERLDRQAALLARMQSVAAGFAALQRRAEARQREGAEARQPEGAALPFDASDELLAAGLQERLQRLATEAGAQLASTEVLASEPGDGLRRIRVRASLTAPWPAVAALLHALAAEPQGLLVDDLSLRMAGGEQGSRLMEASFVVIALRATGGRT
jgi:hypothetical protein